MMKGSGGWGLGFSKIISILFVAFVFLYPIPYTLYPSFAAESSPSADIKSKLEEFRKEAASKAAQLKELISKKLQNKVYVGKIKSKSDNSLTLSTDNGPKVVSTNQDTVFTSKIKSKQKFTLSEEDYVAALGDIDETAVLTARKIVLLPPPDTSKTYLWGQVISVSDKLVTIKDKGSKTISASLPDKIKVKLNDVVILTGNKDKNDIFEAGFAYVYPPEGIIKPRKIATQSAQIASPSAKPKR